MPGNWKKRFHNIARDVVATYMALRDPGVPFLAKATAVLSIFYVILPIDLIPDFIPFIGWLDDLAAVPLAAYLATRLIPFDTLARLRRDAETKLMRWGPRVTWLVAAFIVVWLILAILGVWMVLTRPENPVQPPGFPQLHSTPAP